MDLSVGLAIGFAAAGGVGGVAWSVKDGLERMVLAKMLRNSGRFLDATYFEPSYLRSAFMGGIMGGIAGFGAGQAVEYIFPENHNEEIIQRCVDSAPEGNVARVSRDSLGNLVCSHE